MARADADSSLTSKPVKTPRCALKKRIPSYRNSFLAEPAGTVWISTPSAVCSFVRSSGHRPRSRQELSNAYFLAKFLFVTAENGPCKICRIPRCTGSSNHRTARACTIRSPRRTEKRGLFALCLAIIPRRAEACTILALAYRTETTGS